MQKKCLFIYFYLSRPFHSLNLLTIKSFSFLFYSPVFERNEYTIKVLESMPINSQVNDRLNMHLKEAFYELMSL